MPAARRLLAPLAAAAVPAARRLLAPLALAAVLAGAAGAGAATPGRIVQLLNRERARNHLPAGLVDNSSWSAACGDHNAYERRNGGLGHEEQPGRPGYSAVGDEIARSSVLAQGLYWRHRDPYDNAPFHLFDLLNPRLSSIGASDSRGFGCVEVELGALRPPPAAPVGYSYPGPGRQDVPASQRAIEAPATPAAAVGLGAHPTGPNIFVYFDGPWTNGSRLRIASAVLTGAGGAVSLRWLDNTTSDLLAPTGAILVPVRSLQRGARYRVQVRGSVTGIVPGTTIEEALASCGETEATASCGEPPPTACFEDFARQAAVCGLSRTWAVAEDFTFKTAGRR